MDKYVVPVYNNPKYTNDTSEIQNVPSFFEPNWLPGANTWDSNTSYYIKNILLGSVFSQSPLAQKIGVNYNGAINISFNIKIDLINVNHFFTTKITIDEMYNVSYFLVYDNNIDLSLGYFVTNYTITKNTINYNCSLDPWIYICQKGSHRGNLFLNRRTAPNYNINNTHDFQMDRWYNFNLGNGDIDTSILNHDSFCSSYTSKYDDDYGHYYPIWWNTKQDFTNIDNWGYQSTTGFFMYAILNKIPTDPDLSYTYYAYDVGGSLKEFPYPIEQGFFSKKWTERSIIQSVPNDTYTDRPFVQLKGDLKTDVLQSTPYLIIPYAINNDQPEPPDTNYLSFRYMTLDKILSTNVIADLIGFIASPFPIASFINKNQATRNYAGNIGSLVTYGTALTPPFIAPSLVDWNIVNTDSNYSGFVFLNNFIFHISNWDTYVNLENKFNEPSNNPHSHFREHFEIDIFKVKKQSYILHLDNLLYNQPISEIIPNGFDLKAQCYFSTGLVGYYLFANCGMYKELFFQQNYGLFVSGLYNVPNSTSQWQQFLNSNYSTFSANQLNNSLNFLGQTSKDILQPWQWGQAAQDIFGGGTQQQRLLHAKIDDIKRSPNTVNNSSLNDYVIDKMGNKYNPNEIKINRRQLSETDLKTVSQHFYFNGHPFNKTVDYDIKIYGLHYWFDFLQSDNITNIFSNVPQPILSLLKNMFKTGIRQWYVHQDKNYDVMHNKNNLQYDVIKDLIDRPIGENVSRET